MLRTEGEIWLHQLRRRWVIADLLLKVAVCTFFGLIIIALTSYFYGQFQAWSLLLIPLSIALVFYFKPSWKTNDYDLSRYADQYFPELEESSSLLLTPDESLSMLQRLQKEKINGMLSTLPKVKTPDKKLFQAGILLLTGVLLSFLIAKLPKNQSPNPDEVYSQVSAPGFNENVPAELLKFNATIQPPAYTGMGSRTQKQFALKAENGSTVHWEMESNQPLNEFTIIFNDQERIKLKPVNAGRTAWSYSKLIVKPGFYQLVINGKKSDLYQIEIIPDLPVSIKITEPKPRTTIDIGQPAKINLKASLSDDYGIQNAFISATMASGKGEGVSFTEKKLTFDLNFNNKKTLAVQKSIDLKSLGMKPGDELYFFISASDNHGQTSRSDVYFVSIVDTTELMSLAGMTNGVNLVPEYFRSQRQIIIDTEKLLKEQSALSAEAFKNRSNNLGIDQKLLRLRYGQFLGEESETEIGGDQEDHDDGHEKNEAHEEKFGDATAIMDKYAHKHDIAEDATFFEPEMKAQLKAVLTEMWNSELRLRTYKPLEYKALRLLKDLQQKSRAYVAKTTVKTATLKPEKRLTGDLEKIMQPVQKMTYEQKEFRSANLKHALVLLEERKSGTIFGTTALNNLKETEKYMIGAAADHPGTYLPALTGLRKLMFAKTPVKTDLNLVEKAIQKMIGVESAKPGSNQAAPGSALYQSYFKNLNRSGR